MSALKKHLSRGGIGPYVVIGGIALVVELSSFYLLAEAASLQLVFSNVTAMLLGMVTSFWLNSRYNFRVTDRLAARFASFAAITGLSVLMSSALLVLFADVMGIAPFVAKLITLPIMLVIQFTLNRRLTFAPAKTEVEAEE